VSVNGGTTRTFTYVGEHYVKEVAGSSTEHKLYLFANGEPFGYVSDTGSAPTLYFHKDHLGSITTIITNQNWAGREKLSYDAWGKRRSGTDWWSAASTPNEERGYTGHEHLDNVSLIHMNGRLLDPKLGRVISPDPFVQAPLYSQNYNRYAYAFNNPLRYVDPSGFGACDFFSFFCGIPNWLHEHSPGGPDCDAEHCSPSFGGYTPAIDMSGYYDALQQFMAQQQYQQWQSFLATIPSGQFGFWQTDEKGQKPIVFTRPPDSWSTMQLGMAIASGEVSLSGLFAPNVVALGDRGVPGSFGANLAGAGKVVANTVLGLEGAIVGVVAPDFLHPFIPIPQFQVADDELLGAASAESAILVGGAIAGPAGARSLATRTPEGIIARIAQQHADSGVEGLTPYLSRDELNAVLSGSRATRAMLGKGVHEATAASLRARYPGEYIYLPRAPFDFIHVPTGQALELTTYGEAASHANRGANLVLYNLH